MSENKYSLICSTFTGTLNQLHFILFIHLSSHFIFQFLHVVLWSTLACLLHSPQSNSKVERFKEGLKTGPAGGRNFVTAVRHMLVSYRATPHCTTGVAPTSPMLSFPWSTPLTLLQQSATTSSTSPSASPTPSPIHFREQLMSRNHDARHHAKPMCLSAEDQSRIKVPNWAHKLASVYFDPVRVIKVVSNTVWLEIGQRWNVRHCLPCRSSLRRE